MRVRRLAVLAVLFPLIAVGLPAELTAHAADLDHRRVDAVATPILNWAPCDLGECARVLLPLDYDVPGGPTVEVALTRIPARDPSRRLGSLFLNPGGPGASGTDFPLRATAWLGADVQDRFDLIGMDPRGTNDSTRSHCFPTVRRLVEVAGPLLTLGFPVSADEEDAFMAAAGELAHACSSRGRRLVGAMSTAEVARDLDVLRRAVGDDRLTFLGFSYGTYLGQVYANMFPDRVRALALDGVLDPTAWVGSAETAEEPMSLRLGSAQGASEALSEGLRRCGDHPEACPLSDPAADFARLAERLRRAPLRLEDPELGAYDLTYQQFITACLYALYSDHGVELVAGMTAALGALAAEPSGLATRRALAAQYRVQESAATRAADRGDYPNFLEQVPAVMCTDSRNPASMARWAELADAADAAAPYFGRSWLWGSAYCAGDDWLVQDEDAYRGPFDRAGERPILVVGNHHDPATPYRAAVAVSRLLPNSRLLSSDNWGHTAYGVSACSTAAVDAYLIDGRLPDEGTVCRDGHQPFEE